MTATPDTVRRVPDEREKIVSGAGTEDEREGDGTEVARMEVGGMGLDEEVRGLEQRRGEE